MCVKGPVHGHRHRPGLRVVIPSSSFSDRMNPAPRGHSEALVGAFASARDCKSDRTARLHGGVEIQPNGCQRREIRAPGARADAVSGRASTLSSLARHWETYGQYPHGSAADVTTTPIGRQTWMPMRPRRDPRIRTRYPDLTSGPALEAGKDRPQVRRRGARSSCLTTDSEYAEVWGSRAFGTARYGNRAGRWVPSSISKGSGYPMLGLRRQPPLSRRTENRRDDVRG